MKSKLLSKANKITKELFETVWLNNTILSVSLEETEPPFLLLLEQKETTGKLLLSFPIDAPDVLHTAKLILMLTEQLDCDICEQFYLSENGSITFGEEAVLMYEKENTTGYIAISGSKTIN